jgi:hypothetical protein
VLFRRSLSLFVVLVSLIATGMAADAKSNIFTITVAPPTATKDLQVRYYLGGQFGGFSASSSATSADNKIVIQTLHDNTPATSFKAIAFAPGCQIVTFSVDDLSSGNREGQFECQKLPTTLLQGRVPLSGLSGAEGKDLQVTVLYVCNWAPQFFNMGQGAISPLFVAKTTVGTDGSFSFELPDFASDPLWSTLSNDAALNFYLIDAATGAPLTALTPPGALSPGNSLKVGTGYPGEMQFSLTSQTATAAK